ncbi:MAG TPA: hypothetical protein VGO61_11825 [Steroidobacteraceae bacterium]|jgi:hypothetical protein|nr:hypothetical protein [Steroidobacteraceae bacterium]
MKVIRLALCALAFTVLAQARPVVLEEVATLTPPDASWQYFGRAGVAIDGDFALISGERYYYDPTQAENQHVGAALLYQRSGTSWNYVRVLGPEIAFNDFIIPGLAMKDGVAMTIFGRTRIFERTGTTWTEAPLTEDLHFGLQGADIEIDAGRILVPRSCGYNSVVLRKINGAWAIEGELNGNSTDCGESSPTMLQDLQGDRAIVHNPVGFYGEISEPTVVRQYRLNANGVGWSQTGVIQNGSVGNILGPHVGLSFPNLAITGRRERGTSVAYELPDGRAAWARYGLQAADSYLDPEEPSASSIERVGSLFAQRNYSFNRKSYVINLFAINDDEVRSSTHVATLQTREGTSFGYRLDASGNRIITNGWFAANGLYAGDNTVRVFELPAKFEHAPVQVHDFESPSAATAWQPTAGSTFSIVTSGTTRVYRQASTAGNPAAYLPTSTARNQAIQSEVTVRDLTGANAWVGLTTRRLDDSNYYYVTLRLSGTVELKRMVGGVVTSLAAAPATVTTNRKYRLRLESIGTLHRVYFNDSLVLTARDAALSEGTAGVMTNAAAADYDNVLVTPNPFTTIYKHSFTSSNPGLWSNLNSTWESAGGVYHQTSTYDYAHAYTGAATDDQIVQVRIRPTSFQGPDNWVGVMARFQDDHNYLFVTLRNRGVISLWRRTQSTGNVQLATRAFPVTTGTWYSVRVEIVNGLTRVFVNDQLQLSASADPGPTNPNVAWERGQVGLVTYKATADYDDFLAYQP